MTYYASSNKNYDLHPNMCNDKLHLPSVLLVGNTPPKYAKNEDWRLQNMNNIMI